MCGNRLTSFKQFETVLTHELLHAFDHCRAEIDPFDLRHHACMEVRAASLSGDCEFKREAKLGNLNLTKQHPVRARAKQESRGWMKTAECRAERASAARSPLSALSVARAGNCLYSSDPSPSCSSLPVHPCMYSLQACVRRRAVISVMSNVSCSGIEEAKAAVDDIFDRCYADTEPFGAIP
jgi:hypothetical protein